MSLFRAVSHVELNGRRVRASATFTFTLSVEEVPRAEAVTPRRKETTRGWIPAGLQDPSVRWDVLPERIRPEDWTTGQTVAELPESIIVSDRERLAEAFRGCG